MKRYDLVLFLTLFLLQWRSYVGATVPLDDWPLVAPNELQQDLRGYNIVSNYCWLLAHTSVIVGKSILVDGGLAKFHVVRNGEDVGVSDFNGATVSVDLTRDFDIDSPNLEIVAKKTPNVPVVTRGGMWTDGKLVWVQGGHFMERERYNTSVYFVEKAAIPPYSIWQYSGERLEKDRWEKERFTVKGNSSIERTVSGAPICTNGSCYWLGGYVDSRTSATTPENYSASRRGMLVFDTATRTLRNETIDGYGRPDEGFQFGTLVHIPSDKGKGLLVSLMGEKHLISEPNTTSSDLNGEGVSLQYVMLYDIETAKWYNQTTVAQGFGKEPLIRTRFCTGVVYDKSSNSYDLFMYGGQSVHDVTLGVDSIFVLTMPAFSWVEIPMQSTVATNYLRSHSCHIVGSQMLIIGGGPPSDKNGGVEQRARCNERLVNVLDLNQEQGTFTKTFRANSPLYTQPSAIRAEAYGITEPKALGGWTDERIKEIWPSAPKKMKRNPRLSSGAIAGIVVSLVAMAVIAFAVWWLLKPPPHLPVSWDLLDSWRRHELAADSSPPKAELHADPPAYPPPATQLPTPADQSS